MKSLRVALLLLVACKGRASDVSTVDASPTPRVTASVDASSDASGPSAASIDADAAKGPSDAGPTDAAGVRADGELSLHVQGGYCLAERQSAPGCRSYTYALRTDGKLRGSRRRSVVPAAEVDVLFSLAEEAFAAKRACIPSRTDVGWHEINLRQNGKTQTARGACGARFDDLKARLEALAAGD